MHVSGQGAGVRFRVHIVRVPGFVSGGFASPQGAGQAFIKVIGSSPEIGGSDDSDPSDRASNFGLFIAGSFVVRIEVGDAVPGNAFDAFANLLKQRLKDPVKASAARLWISVLEELEVSESPSLPGRPPGRRTGELARSIGIALDEDGLGAWVTSELDYAAHLEAGTHNMAERPFLAPALERNKPIIEARLKAAAQAVLQDAGATVRDAALHEDLEAFEAIMDVLKSGSDVSEAFGGRQRNPDRRTLILDMIGSLEELAEPSTRSEEYITSAR